MIAAAAFPWFLDANQMVQFIIHAFLFGAGLGWQMWSARRGAEARE